MSATWRACIALIDVVTALCAALNFAYFARRFTSPGKEAPSRRMAVLVLAMVSLGTLVESLALLAIGAEAETPALASGSGRSCGRCRSPGRWGWRRSWRGDWRAAGNRKGRQEQGEGRTSERFEG